MRKKYIRIASKAACWAPRLSSLAVFLLVGAIITHRFSIITTRELLVLAVIVVVAALLGLVLACKGLSDLWKRGDAGGMKSLFAIVYMLIVAVPLGYAAIQWYMLPPLNDISSDPVNPPAFIAGLRPLDAWMLTPPSDMKTDMQIRQWPQLSGRRYDGSPDRVLEAVRKVIEAQGWSISGEKGKSGEDSEFYVEAVAKTFYLGFVSDVVVRLIDEGDTTFVDMRAASRDTQRDFGANARFIANFMDALDTEILLSPDDQESE